MQEFLAGTVPFIREAVAQAQPVMVAVTEPKLTRLRAELAGEVDRVQFVDMAELGHNPALILSAWLRFMQLARGRPARGIGEPIWAGRRPAEILEAQLHEALLNRAVDPATTLWLRCPYDADTLDAAIIEEAHRSHPMIIDHEEYRGSILYGGTYHAQLMFRSDLPHLGDPSYTMPFTGQNLTAVRSQVYLRALQTGIPMQHALRLHRAVHEVAKNSLQRGGGQGCLRVWQHTAGMSIEIRDPGRLDDPLTGRLAPPPDAANGGLWRANQLTDLLHIRSNTTGTTVRIHHWLDRAAP